MAAVTLRSLALGVCLSAVAATPAPAAVPTLPPGDLRPGQKAEVRTVFAGRQIETFEAEILGVVHGGRAEGDMILARATSDRVIKTGIAAGMSGSPVYVDGRLIGALSSGWTFEREPIFGVTPIGEMLAVLDQPDVPGDGSSQGPSGVDPGPPPAGQRFREFRWPGDADSGTEPGHDAGAGSAEPSEESLAPLPVPLACSGLDPAAMEPARKWLAPLGLAVVPGGTASSPPPPAADMEPGAAVAVDLMRGDLEMSAIGTVTYRDGDRVLIFGHPFFQSGPVRMPLATAEIVTVVPNQASSFKVGVRGKEVGVATQDRRAAVAGELKGHARLLPLAVTVRAAGRPAQHFHFEAIEDRLIAPSLVAIGALNSLLESGGTGSGQSLRWKLRVASPGRAPLELADVADGDGAIGELASGIGAPLRYLLNNPYQRLALDSVSVELDTRPGRDQWSLRSARLDRAAVRPGARAVVQCEVERWRGGREWVPLEIEIPEEAPPGRYTLWIGGGSELTRFEAQRSPAHFRPMSLDDAWRRLARSRSNDALYAALIARAPEITSEGQDYPELPGSGAFLLTSGTASADRGRSETAWLAERRRSLDGLVQGELLLEIHVDDHAP